MLLNLSGIVDKPEFRTNNSATSNKATAHTHTHKSSLYVQYYIHRVQLFIIFMQEGTEGTVARLCHQLEAHCWYSQDFLYWGVSPGKSLGSKILLQ